MSEFVERPWGGYRVLGQTDRTLVKELTFTGGFIRPQRHHKRAEHWQLLEGKIVGYVQADWDDHRRGKYLQAPNTLVIPMNAWHWLGGIGTVLETWHGDELSEDDIEVRDLP